MLPNRQRRTIPNLLVTSLAVTALCLGGFVPAPLGPVGLATSKWPFNNLICQFQGYFAIMLAAASIHTLVLKAVNRYFRVVKPSKYRRYLFFKCVENGFSSIQVLLLWFIIDSDAFAAFLVAVYVGIPSCYFRIFKTIRSHNNNLSHPGNGTNTVSRKKLRWHAHYLWYWCFLVFAGLQFC